jgi:hypothetical protein
VSAEFICRDAVPWLAHNRDVGAIVTSLPDSDEVEMSIADWIRWFTDAVCACMNSASESSCSIFYQTDRKVGGSLISKSHLVFNAAERAGVRCLFHKIALRRAVDSIDMYRPTFTHMIAFSRKLSSGRSTPDVIQAGRFDYANAAGLNAARFLIEFASMTTTQLVDPFCGHGTFVHAASQIGMKALGIDIDPKQIEHAESNRTLF